MQQYMHNSDLPACPLSGRFRVISGHTRALPWAIDKHIRSMARRRMLANENVDPDADTAIAEQVGRRRTGVRLGPDGELNRAHLAPWHRERHQDTTVAVARI